MDPGNKMDCRATGEFVWKAQTPFHPFSVKNLYLKELMLPTTTVKGKALCSMNRPLINSIS